MSQNLIDYTLEHMTNLVGDEPTLLDLLYFRDLWKQIHNYWEIFNEEIEQRVIGFEPIRIFDFDLIYPSLWSAEIQKSTNLERRIGFPTTASFVFRNTETNFTLPPGTLYELSSHINKLQNTFNINSKNLAKRIEKIRWLKDNYKSPLHPTFVTTLEVLTEMGNEFEQEIDQLIETGARLEGLNSVLEHERYQPWKDIVKKTGATISPAEVIKFWEFLKADRTHPQKDLNNYLDAINVASYYSLTRTGNNYGEDSILFPVFATGTQVVLRLPKPINRGEYRPSLLENLIKPVSVQYLSFATALEVYAENDLERLSSLAETGLEKIRNVLRKWSKFFKDVTRQYHPKTHDKKEICYKSILLGDLRDIPSFTEFCKAYSIWKTSFEEETGSIFFNITRSDRQISENFSVIKQYLLKDIQQNTSSEISKLKYLSAYDTSFVFDWSRLASFIDTSLVIRDKSNLSVGEISLTTLRDTKLILEEAEIFSEPNPTLRTKVFLSDIKQLLFYWERTVGSNSQLFCWQYSLNLQKILNFVGTFLADIHPIGRGKNTARLRVYADNLFEELSIESLIPRTQLLEKVLSVSPNPTYLRIDTDICIIFLDVMPIESTESLEIAINYENPSIHRFVADLHQQTSNTPFPKEIIKAFLKEFSQEFKKKESRIEGFAKSLRKEFAS